MALLTFVKNLFAAADLRDQPDTILQGVRRSYSLAASDPKGRHPFPCGMAFAIGLGYPEVLLAKIPQSAKASFAGVSKVSLFADLAKGATVLDLGCGSGLDSLVAAGRVGPTGQVVVGVDFSLEMVNKARQAAFEANLANLRFICAEAERLPITDQSADVVLINGIFNLNPGRNALFAEISRIVKPTGWVYAAELVLTGPLPRKKLRRLDDRFS